MESILVMETQPNGQKISILDGCPPNDPKMEFSFSPAGTVYTTPTSPFNQTVAKRVAFGDM